MIIADYYTALDIATTLISESILINEIIVDLYSELVRKDVEYKSLSIVEEKMFFDIMINIVCCYICTRTDLDSFLS